MIKQYFALAIAALAIAACERASISTHAPASEAQCDVSLIVLGVAQDAGKPQIGNPQDPAWADATLRRRATSLALVDRRGDKTRRWLFEATPDVKDQLHLLNALAPGDTALSLEGVFITHAHIGHYAGLAMFGHEGAGVNALQVYVMPRMASFIGDNGPWSQLIRFQNIILAIMTDGERENLGEDLYVTPFLVPHRQEFSEVAGFKIEGPSKTALFIPDIDSWEDWDQKGVRIEDMIASVDIAYLDATFYGDGEIPGRDMSGFPHPFVNHSMVRFAELPETEKSKVRFIHMNHTNPLHSASSEEAREVRAAKFNIAEESEEICL